MNDPNQTAAGADDPNAELLARLLAREVDFEDAQVRAAMAADPEFARRAVELLDLADDIGLASALPDSDSLAAEPEPWPGADRAIRELVLARAGSTATRPAAASPAHRPRTWRLVAVVAAAAVILLAVWFGRDPTPPSPVPRDTTLSRGELQPSTTVTRSELAAGGLRWGDLGLRPGQELRLTVLDRAGVPIVDNAEVTGRSSWPFPADRLAGLQDGFTWKLIAPGVGGNGSTWQRSVTLSH